MDDLDDSAFLREVERIDSLRTRPMLPDEAELEALSQGTHQASELRTMLAVRRETAKAAQVRNWGVDATLAALESAADNDTIKVRHFRNLPDRRLVSIYYTPQHRLHVVGVVIVEAGE